jgi:hypothetical protein
VNSDFLVAYGGGDGATGDFVKDTLKIGSATVNAFQFGVMYQTTVVEGILGVSFPQTEAPVIDGYGPQYDNLPVALVKSGIIASKAFSLYTNDDRSAAGTLLFGGIDTKKYCGSLVSISLVPSGFSGSGQVEDFTVPLLGISGTDTTGAAHSFSGAQPTTILLDSGTTFTQLPPDLVTSIWSFAGATADSGSPSLATIPCSAGSSKKTISFKFSGITITVPMSQLVVFPDATNTNCYFGISKTASTIIIGDTVLSSMYVVYDLDNKKVLLAPAILNVATSNILQIQSGPSGVPKVAGAACPSTAAVITYTSLTFAKAGCIPGGYYQATDQGQGTQTALPATVKTNCEKACTAAGTKCQAYLAQFNYAADSKLATAVCYFYSTAPTALATCANKPSKIAGELKHTS